MRLKRGESDAENRTMRNRIVLAAAASGLALATVVGVAMGAGHDEPRLVRTAGVAAPVAEESTTSTSFAPLGSSPELATKVDSQGAKLANHEARIGVLESTTTTAAPVAPVAGPAPAPLSESTTTTTGSNPGAPTTTSTTIFQSSPRPTSTTTTIPLDPVCGVTARYVSAGTFEVTVTSNRPGVWSKIYMGSGPWSEVKNVLLDNAGGGIVRFSGVADPNNWLVGMYFGEKVGPGYETCEAQHHD